MRTITIGLEVNKKEIHYIYAYCSKKDIKILNEYYRCPKKVRQLIDLGDMRELRKNVREIRRRGVGYFTYCLSSERFLGISWAYTVLFRNGTWYVSLPNSSNSVLLSEYLRKD